MRQQYISPKISFHHETISSNPFRKRRIYLNQETEKVKKKSILPRSKRAMVVTAIAVVVAVCVVGGPYIFEHLCKAKTKDLTKDIAPEPVQMNDMDDTFQQKAIDYSIKLLLKTTQNEKENRLISPISSLFLLGLVENGVANNTLKQMEQLMGDLDVSKLNDSLVAYRSFLEKTKVYPSK